MKKIMFNDKYGLTQAVIEERKPMTRREVKGLARGAKNLRINNGICEMLYEGATMWVTCNVQPKYKLGEVIAVAQRYRDIAGNHFFANELAADELSVNGMKFEHGWNNKQGVKACYMPTRIRITDIKAERLQECSNDDMLKEGIIQSVDGMDLYTFDGWVKHCKGHNLPIQIYTKNIREAFVALIDKVSGKGTWDSNPWVFAYTFELVKGGEK